MMTSNNQTGQLEIRQQHFSSVICCQTRTFENQSFETRMNPLNSGASLIKITKLNFMFIGMFFLVLSGLGCDQRCTRSPWATWRQASCLFSHIWESDVWVGHDVSFPCLTRSSVLVPGAPVLPHWPFTIEFYCLHAIILVFLLQGQAMILETQSQSQRWVKGLKVLKTGFLKS